MVVRNLCIDRGNSSSKIAVFEGDSLLLSAKYDDLNAEVLATITSSYAINNCILSSVVNDNNTIVRYMSEHNIRFDELTHTTALPILNKYETPETLGKDRLAAVVGAASICPGHDLLVIDAGTAITYDFLTAEGVYHGGNIAAGIDMRLNALHIFTQKLPLVTPSVHFPLLGTNTNSALIAGAVQGVIFEIEGYINHLKFKYPELLTFLTGGSSFYFDTKLKSAIFAENNLVLIGLNRILQHNA